MNELMNVNESLFAAPQPGTSTYKWRHFGKYNTQQTKYRSTQQETGKIEVKM